VENIVKDKYLRAVFGLGLLILLIAFFFIYVEFDVPAESPAGLIIHFDAYKGIDFIGGKLDVFGILITALAIILINLFLADFLYHRERFLSYIFGFGSLGLSILILIAIGVIISVN
jgi:hypothetical protein